MTRTPRNHQPASGRIHAAATAAGPQDIDTVDDGDATSVDADGLVPTTSVREADVATSTEDGRDVGRETGTLYGQAIAPTGDVDGDDVRTMQDWPQEGAQTNDDGQTWTEQLMTSASEHGTRGEAAIDADRGTDAEIEPSDDDDDDRPLADLGAAGPAGL